ncbi:ComF family protein [Sporolactobacillus kofuensis]|uniref:ComF family protein n=1 Tax=Sporolactobacillus kofuensis TaxID=269672 RepID=A0ABW1WJK0_9BACL|nr:ComF family protein [Sporolactobacillus kofuensis]MCO7176429.1 ComF family protein [Sporolactobacillus kofuensis]
MNHDRCLICRVERQEPLTFRTFLSSEHQLGFCASCREKLERIDWRHSCRQCGRDLQDLAPVFVHDHRCHDCLQWANSERNGLYGRNYAVYNYNPFMKEVMTAFKFRGDAVIASGFEKEVKQVMKWINRPNLHPRFWKKSPTCTYDFLVPVPLSVERLNERGFNQAEVLAEQLGQPIVSALVRKKNEQKQSKKDRNERIRSRNTPFSIKNDMLHQISGKKILLVDDIYTTGATIRLAAEALSPAHPARIDSFTLIHG